MYAPRSRHKNIVRSVEVLVICLINKHLKKITGGIKENPAWELLLKPGLSLHSTEELMDTIRQNQSESIKELATALSKAQAELKGAKKDGDNPFFKSHYATLESVYEAIREPLARNGLAVTQPTEMLNTTPVVRTVLMHSSGEWIDGLYPITPEKPGPQSLGSATTYSRRFSLMSMVGVAAIDDDAESATARTETVVQRDPNPSGVSMPNNVISEKQRKRMYAIWKSRGWTDADVQSLIQSFGYKKTDEIKWKDYDTIVAALEAGNKMIAPEGFEFVGDDFPFDMEENKK